MITTTRLHVSMGPGGGGPGTAAANAAAEVAAGGTTIPPRSDLDVRTMPQLMSSLWKLVSGACVNMHKGDSATVMFPNMASLSDPSFVAKLMAHLDACKDVCDNFGVNTVLVPIVESNNEGKRVVRGFAVKSYRNPYNVAGTYSSDASQMTFAPDPFWDDDEEWDFGGGGTENDDNNLLGGDHDPNLPEISNLIPADDSVVIDLTQKWVKKMMADLALCPFTQSAERSGIPLGPVRYAVDRVSAMEDAYLAYWDEVRRIEECKQDEISTTLHILPEFCMNSVELFEQWADTLTGTLEALGVEELLQLIFFHPQWTFRDGGDRSGSAGLAANYARRSPWPMVNVLRTEQVRVAQKGIPTGLVYQQNEKTLGRIGTTQLEKMLRLRDWSDIEGVKVDRKDMEALRVANDLQVEGVSREEDTSFAFDSTPAANRVDRSQIDGGDMTNVIQQALEIRLGRMEGVAAAAGGLLNGAQTSAAMMASDFLLEELGRIAEEYPDDQRAPVIDVRDDGGGRPSSAMASGGYAASYGIDMEEDLGFGSNREAEEAEMAALWGGGGIPMTASDDPRGGSGGGPRGHSGRFQPK